MCIVKILSRGSQKLLTLRDLYVFMFTAATKPNEAAVEASSVVSQVVAEKSKPFRDGE